MKFVNTAAAGSHCRSEFAVQQQNGSVAYLRWVQLP
jgi:hypothetical protein